MIKVIVDDSSKDGTQDGVHGYVRGVQEGHYSAKGGDVGVFGD